MISSIVDRSVSSYDQRQSVDRSVTNNYQQPSTLRRQGAHPSGTMQVNLNQYISGVVDPRKAAEYAIEELSRELAKGVTW